MVYFAPLNHLSPTKTVLLQSCRPIVSTPRRPKSILSGDKQTSLLVKLFRVLAFAGNFYLTSSCLKRQERPRARHAVAKPVPLCVNSPGRVSIHMALFGFGRSRKLFSGFFLAFLTQKSVAFDLILLLPDFSSRNLARTSLFWEVHFARNQLLIYKSGNINTLFGFLHPQFINIVSLSRGGVLLTKWPNVIALTSRISSWKLQNQ